MLKVLGHRLLEGYTQMMITDKEKAIELVSKDWSEYLISLKI